MSTIPVKPKLEDAAAHYLDGEALANVLDFCAFLRANRMTPTFGSKSKVGISYTSRVCYVKLFHGDWFIWPAGRHREYTEAFLSCEELKETVRTSLAACTSCGHQCNGGAGQTITVCGEAFTHICGCCPVRFRNPDAEALRVIKYVIEKRNRDAKK